MSEKPQATARKALRSRIERQLKREQEEKKRELLRKRIEIAKEGVRLYAAGKMIEAVKHYQKYLLIVEMWKKVGREELTPELFDKKKDVYELILISGVYWDLARLYDRAKKEDQKEELERYLEKFIIFSKGFPYQALSAEAIRRYLGGSKCRHRNEFRKAYTALANDRCYIVTALVDVTAPESLPILRAFRDEVLTQSVPGRLLVQLYYQVGPTLAKFTDFLPMRVRQGLGALVDLFARQQRPEGSGMGRTEIQRD